MQWGSFVAIGDSFTEGLDDPGPNGQFRGWADRTAERIAAINPGLRYANVAIRGKLLGEIVAEQVPLVGTLHPDLVTFCGGGNDLIMPSADPDSLAELYESAVSELRAGGSEVVIFTGFDTRDTPVLRRVRGKVATYNAHLRAIADRYDCRVVDLWSMRVLQDRRMWSEDRLHLTPEGHHRVALRTCEVLGVPVEEDWALPLPEEPPLTWVTQRRGDLHWARAHLVPWLGRTIRGVSTGDNLQPKRPELIELVDSDR
ncbi:SGNH/GDSL hydrolase family protein [Allokutzneria sp. A3M-2-11 16]|uniref:SGNH/GDSL hydrolase family protein n=1 Tax=Allokutzneria sp. A3M-2-11 16 TaxID=2962043 RepID=UPI0020B78571|nr:SGNH/GDSL hydrolase family protein [Allokutzneria sp. A3M-2-11 16]MCP3800005.1 SGNH/GDSL hydrolase family protein [Allokutzneria sp. A3M-2-11 16]